MAFLLDDILMAPANFTIWIAEKIQEEINKQRFNVEALKKSLEALQERHDREEIPDEMFQALEEKLLEALAEARRFHAEQEKGT